MFDPKITISRDVFALLKQAAEIDSCSSVNEWCENILKKAATEKLQTSKRSLTDSIELTRSQVPDVSQEEADRIAAQLKGLGYLE